MPKAKTLSLRPALARVSRTHLLLAVVFALQIIVYDAGKLITPDVILRRWIGVGVFTLVTSICWFVARTHESDKILKRFLWLLIITDIALTSWYVYLERGMASRAVLLYVVPIITSAILLRKGAIYLTAIISIIAYVLTANAYFVINFNEGYKLELYGEISFYSILLLIISSLLWSVIKTKKHH